MRLKRVVEEFSRDKSKINTDLIISWYNIIKDDEKMIWSFITGLCVGAFITLGCLSQLIERWTK